MHRVIVGVKVVTVYQQQPLRAAATAAATCGHRMNLNFDFNGGFSAVSF